MYTSRYISLQASKPSMASEHLLNVHVRVCVYMCSCACACVRMRMCVCARAHVQHAHSRVESARARQQGTRDERRGKERDRLMRIDMVGACILHDYAEEAVVDLRRDARGRQRGALRRICGSTLQRAHSMRSAAHGRALPPRWRSAIRRRSSSARKRGRRRPPRCAGPRSDPPVCRRIRPTRICAGRARPGAQPRTGALPRHACPPPSGACPAGGTVRGCRHRRLGTPRAGAPRGRPRPARRRGAPPRAW